MADKSVGELPQAEYFDENSLLVVENQGQAKKVSGKQIQEFSALPIANLSVFAKTLPPGESATVEKQLVDGVYRLVFGIPSGRQGAKGDTPYIGINLNWWISGEDTGISAVGGGNSDSGSVVIQADLRENNQNALSYVKGRTHWKEEFGGGEVILETAIPPTIPPQFVDHGALSLEIGKSYRVTLNGEESVHECRGPLFGDTAYIGNATLIEGATEDMGEDTGESFVILDEGVGFNIFWDDTLDYGFTIKVQSLGEVIYHPLRREYIPNGVPYAETAKVGQTIVVSEVDGEGKPTKWEAADLPPESGTSGGSGIHVGDTAPSDTSMLWVDTSDNEGSTVDSVNGKTGTVVLTAEDVGAMPAGASVDYTLPVASAETLGGIKVGEGLRVDASGVLSASGGGSSGGGGGVPTWSLLGEYDMSTIADSANISLTGLDNLTYLYFKWESLQNETSTDSNYWLSINGTQLGQYILNRKSGTLNYGYTICKWNGLVWEIQMSAGAISDTNYTLNTGNALFPYNHVVGVGACTTLSAFIANHTYKPVSGVLKIYGGK